MQKLLEADRSWFVVFLWSRFLHAWCKIFSLRPDISPTALSEGATVLSLIKEVDGNWMDIGWTLDIKCVG